MCVMRCEWIDKWMDEGGRECVYVCVCVWMSEGVRECECVLVEIVT